MKREECKEQTAFNNMVKKFGHALVEEPTTEETPQQKKLREDKVWAAERFGIIPEEVLWYHSGSCYDRIGVTTETAAKKVGEKVKGQTANGGMFHGMPLGQYSKQKDGSYEVYC